MLTRGTVPIGHACRVTDGDAGEIEVSAATRRRLVFATALLLLAIVGGLALLWPGRGQSDVFSDPTRPSAFYDGTVVKTTRQPCANTDAVAVAEVTCTQAAVRLAGGPDRGTTIQLPEEADASGARLEVGDRVVLAYYADQPDDVAYAFADRARGAPLLLLFAVFAAAIVVVARLRGVRTLIALPVMLAVLAAFVVPAILDGGQPVLVALVGGGFVLVAALLLTRGVNVGSAIALLGALSSLAVVGMLAWGLLELTSITGSEGDVARLQLAAVRVPLAGLVLAGIVIGTLGVLADLAVAQVSAVWDLRQEDPDIGRRPLFWAALGSGRERMSSWITMLVLAYAGASLPLFLLVSQSHDGLWHTASSEVVAIEIVRALVGSIGLVASVPITTIIATWAVCERPTVVQRDDPRSFRSRTERELFAQDPELPPNRAL